MAHTQLNGRSRNLAKKSTFGDIQKLAIHPFCGDIQKSVYWSENILARVFIRNIARLQAIPNQHKPPARFTDTKKHAANHAGFG